MISETAEVLSVNSTQIALNLGSVAGLIGVIWKMAVNQSRTKHKIEALENKNIEHKEDHKEIKKTMDLYQNSIHELKIKLDTSVSMNSLQFQQIEAKIDQTQTMILNIQKSNNDIQKMNNETQKELISYIKERERSKE